MYVLDRTLLLALTQNMAPVYWFPNAVSQSFSKVINPDCPMTLKGQFEEQTGKESNIYFTHFSSKKSGDIM